MENKEKIRSLAENVWAYIAAFLRWGVLGLLVGGLGGFVGALFAKSVAWATAMRGANPWLLYLLPVGGLAIVGDGRSQHVRKQLPRPFQQSRGYRSSKGKL